MFSEFNLDKLFSRLRKPKPEVSSLIWGEFVKWAYYIFESERHILFGRIGNFGYKIEEKSGKKIPFLFINDKFLKDHCLTCKFPSFVLKPILKVNAQAILKHLDEAFSEDDVRVVVEGVIASIEEV
jgi:hypothetical protein